jgi:anti-sigma-K factor RskA
VLSTADDRRDLTVEVAGLTAATNTFYEVWLLAPDASRLVSLGLLQPGQAATFELPADLDLAEYPVVDVSLEPMDGDPAHSSDSVVRGTLSA